MYKSRFLIVTIACLALSGCANDRIVNNIPGVYRIDIDQGNILVQENINKLKPGLSRQQVLFALGSPSIKDVFHQDRWDYIYSKHPGNGERIQTRLTLFFENNALTTIAGDYRPEAISKASSSDKEIVVDVPARKSKDRDLVDSVKSWFEFGKE